MHQLIRIVVPGESIWNEDFADIDEPSEEMLERVADHAVSSGIAHMKDSVSVHEGGFADWWERHAGRWAERKNEEHGEDNLYRLIENEPDDVVLIGDAALDEAEEAWETTKSQYRSNFDDVKKEMVENDRSLSEFFEQDPVEMRDESMLKHYLASVFGYAPAPECMMYIAAPWWESVDSQSAYENAVDYIEDGAAVVLFDAHY